MNGGRHDLHHFLADDSLVGVFGVARGLDLSLGSLSEGDAEQTEGVSVGGLGLDECLDEGVPLLDHGASLVTGNVHAVEVRVAIEALHLIDLELQLSPGLGLALVVAVGEGSLEDSSSETVGSLLLTGTLVARSQSNVSSVKAWGEHVVPFLLDEWVHPIVKNKLEIVKNAIGVLNPTQ